VIITNLPSFYKINLYNRINEHTKILVFFTGDTAEMRRENFFNGEIVFEYVNLKEYSTIGKILKAKKIISNSSLDELIACGVNELINWFFVFYNPKCKNATVVESSYHESVTSGIKGHLKKIFFKRISKAYVSGKAQKTLVLRLGFKGEIITTKGVGVFNIINQPEYQYRSIVSFFLYVGRLSEEKNLDFLVRLFNELPQYVLNIVGYGPQEVYLKRIAKNNIKFIGEVDNNLLPDIYQKNDVFILPSISEPWGLVVEEALNNGLPVIVSDKVGCAEELIYNDYNGIIFNSSEQNSLLLAIQKMTDIDYYNQLRMNISKLDFCEIAQYQVNSYL
jgi:glycosyltransferase involved in cell wall biosynthesis